MVLIAAPVTVTLAPSAPAAHADTAPATRTLSRQHWLSKLSAPAGPSLDTGAGSTRAQACMTRVPAALEANRAPAGADSLESCPYGDGRGIVTYARPPATACAET